MLSRCRESGEIGTEEEILNGVSCANKWMETDGVRGVSRQRRSWVVKLRFIMCYNSAAYLSAGKTPFFLGSNLLRRNLCEVVHHAWFTENCCHNDDFQTRSRLNLHISVHPQTLSVIDDDPCRRKFALKAPKTEFIIFARVHNTFMLSKIFKPSWSNFFFPLVTHKYHVEAFRSVPRVLFKSLRD